MFRALISPNFRSTRLCVTACGIMHPRCCRQATSWGHYTTSCNTQSSAPEVGRDQRPKHVEMIGIINKPLLLHLVGVYIIYIIYLKKFLTTILSDCTVLIIFKFVTNICFKSTDLNFFWPDRPLCFKCSVFVFLLKKFMFGLTADITDSLYSI